MAVGVEDVCVGVETRRSKSAKDCVGFAGVDAWGIGTLAFARICARSKGLPVAGNSGTTGCCGGLTNG